MVDSPDKKYLWIMLETLVEMGGAINCSKYKKSVSFDKIGQDFVLAYDEYRKMLALCSSAKAGVLLILSSRTNELFQLELHVFNFDETYQSIQTVVGASSLAPWYDCGTSILHACFVSGTDEVLLVDSSARARIFSPTTMQIR